MKKCVEFDSEFPYGVVRKGKVVGKTKEREDTILVRRDLEKSVPLDRHNLSQMWEPAAASAGFFWR